MGGPTPRSRSLKDTAKKARRMLKRTERPQRKRPQEMESLQVQLQVMSFFSSAVIAVNGIVHIFKHSKLLNKNTLDVIQIQLML